MTVHAYDDFPTVPFNPASRQSPRAIVTRSRCVDIKADAMVTLSFLHKRDKPQDPPKLVQGGSVSETNPRDRQDPEVALLKQATSVTSSEELRQPQSFLITLASCRHCKLLERFHKAENGDDRRIWSRTKFGSGDKATN